MSASEIHFQPNDKYASLLENNKAIFTCILQLTPYPVKFYSGLKADTCEISNYNERS